MIKLTVYVEANLPDKSIQHVFNQQVITIGAAGLSHPVDVPLPDKSLHAEHVKIFQKEGLFIILNNANDPFVTLNGHPFWKRNLINGDRLKIGNAEIVIHCSVPSNIEGQDIKLPSHEDITGSGKEDDNFMHSLQKKITVKAASANSKRYLDALNLPTDHTNPHQEAERDYLDELIGIEERSFWNKEQKAMDIDALMSQVEQLENEDRQSKFMKSTRPRDKGRKIFDSIKEIPETMESQEENKSSDVFDVQFDPNPRDLKKWDVKKAKKTEKNTKESEKEREETGVPPKQDFVEAWKKYLIVISAILVVLIAIAVMLYFSFSDQRDAEEMTAAHSVADIAMAVTSAQLQHSKPLNENWYDPDFLSDNIKAILSAKYSTLCQVDNQGKFSNCPYIFRIYTSNDLSRFILIAQPTPSLLQWLIPKAAILVDSQKMELRKITDISELNHIISEPDPLDGEHLKEIVDLVGKGELISLSDLAKKTNSPEFATPPELAFLRPGAENLIYNSPRYYKFSEPVMQAALKVGSGVEHDHTLNLLWHELDKRTVLHDMVFYTSQGIEASMQAQKILTASQIHRDFFVGYLTFNPKNGHIVNSHLVIAGEELKKDDPAFEHILPKEVAMAYVNISSSEVDMNNPLLGKLRNLAMARQRTLESKSAEITDLFHQQDLSPNVSFYKNIHTALNEYEALSEEQKTSIDAILVQLFQEQEEKGEKMPVQLFLDYISAARLDFYADENLKARLENESKIQDHDFD